MVPISYNPIDVIFPLLPLKGKIIVLLITIVAGFGDITARSHVIKYFIPVLFVLFFYTTRRFVLSNQIMKYTQKVLMLIPLLFFALAVSGIFEIFKFDDYVDGSYVQKAKQKKEKLRKRT